MAVSAPVIGSPRRCPLVILIKNLLKQLWLSTPMMNMRLLGKYGRIQKMCQICPCYEENINLLRALPGALDDH